MTGAWLRGPDGIKQDREVPSLFRCRLKEQATRRAEPAQGQKRRHLRLPPDGKLLTFLPVRATSDNLRLFAATPPQDALHHGGGLRPLYNLRNPTPGRVSSLAHN